MIENLTCCELAKKSELVRTQAKDFPEDKGEIVVIREIQDEFGQTWEQIYFCPFCGKKISIESFDKDNFSYKYLKLTPEYEIQTRHGVEQ